MAGVKAKPLPSGKYRGWYTDWQGKQIWFTGTTNPKETEHAARTFEDHHRRIRIGDLPAPKPSDKPRPFAEVVGEYLAWGSSQGGHGGRPWSTVHLATRTRHLTEFWPDKLHPETVADITLPKVEAIAQELLAAKLTGKTVQAHTESLKAFYLWCKTRGYVEANPLEGMVPFDVTVKEPRRALVESEIQRLLAVAPPDRRVIYEVALCTGYRKGELTALMVKDLDTVHSTLPLAAEFSKGRRDSRQPVPVVLTAKLAALAQGKDPEAALLDVDYHIDRQFHRDRKAAGIPPTAPGGKAVFYSLRHSYCTLVIESGASLTEAQRLMRHTDPKLTANVYSHARPDRLQSVAEAVGKVVMSDENQAHSKHKLAAGAETVDVNACDDKVLAMVDSKNGEGFEPLHPLHFTAPITITIYHSRRHS